MKPFSKIKHGAFTLIELLAAMAITTALVLVIVSLTSRGVDIWRWVLQDVRTTNLARTAMDTMTKDFESMQYRTGNPFSWFLVQRDSDLISGGAKAKTSARTSTKKKRSDGLKQTRVNTMTMGPEGAKITNASQVIFFTSATDRNPAKTSGDFANDRLFGDVNCVGYKLIYRDQILDLDATDDSDGFPVYSVYRNLISAKDTALEMLGCTDLHTAYSQFLADETAPANFLVENVVEMTLIFEVDYQKQNTGGSGNKSALDATQRTTILIPVMTTGGGRAGACTEMEIFGNRLDIKGGSNTADASTGRVLAVNISMTVVTEEGMAVVDQIRKGARVAPSQQEFFERYTRSFSQRIALPTAF